MIDNKGVIGTFGQTTVWGNPNPGIQEGTKMMRGITIK
jgi:hypothetical protein